jgi:ankyrin repeat protein
MSDAPPPPSTHEPDESQVIEFAYRCLDLAREGDTDQLGVYLDGGLPPNLADPDGNSLLMLAAYHGRPDTVRLLLAKGADPDRLNARGQSIIAGALFKGEDEVVQALIEGGADLDAGTPSAREAAQLFGKAHLLP